MQGKRKDNKGRVLKTGESQRSDLTYMYRYTNAAGNRKTVYARTLSELREKEDEIHEDNKFRVITSGETVLSLVKRYVSLKTVLRKSTIGTYDIYINLLSREDIGSMKICDITPYYVRSWLVSQSENGRAYYTISILFNMMKSSFDMAVENGNIKKNPFCMKISSIIKNETKKKEALSPEQIKSFLSFVKDSNVYKKRYDEIVILIHTGLRISELYGLTLDDVDICNRKLYVRRQVQRDRRCKRYIQEPKTANGIRCVPLDDEAAEAFVRAIEERRLAKKVIPVDGVSNFIFLCGNGNVRLEKTLLKPLTNMVEKYNESHEDKLPHITPHVFRHTFCTTCINSGMNVKAVQYLMGHANVSVTMNIYSHCRFEDAEENFKSVMCRQLV